MLVFMEYVCMYVRPKLTFVSFFYVFFLHLPLSRIQSSPVLLIAFEQFKTDQTRPNLSFCLCISIFVFNFLSLSSCLCLPVFVFLCLSSCLPVFVCLSVCLSDQTRPGKHENRETGKRQNRDQIRETGKKESRETGKKESRETGDTE